MNEEQPRSLYESRESSPSPCGQESRAEKTRKTRNKKHELREQIRKLSDENRMWFAFEPFLKSLAIEISIKQDTKSKVEGNSHKK